MSLRLILTQSPPPVVTVHRVSLSELEADGLAALKPEHALVSGDVVD
jgi:hypothetical protein